MILNAGQNMVKIVRRIRMNRYDKKAKWSGAGSVFGFAVILCAVILISEASVQSQEAGKSASGSSYEIISVENGGAVKGVVRFKGKYPRQKRIRINVNVEACGTNKKSETFLVSPKNKGLKNVLVTIEGISAGKAPSIVNVVTVEQQGCTYIPHFQVAEIGPDGIELRFLNEDGIFHNVHSFQNDSTLFNLPQFGENAELTQKVISPGVLRLKCDVHQWMGANVVLLDNQPYYSVTDENGSFDISDVPPGEYTLRAWHEALGVLEKQVMIKSNEIAEVDFVISPKGSK